MLLPYVPEIDIKLERLLTQRELIVRFICFEIRTTDVLAFECALSS
jgi:hypothetical protein